MAHIGTLTRDGKGFVGRLRTLSLDVELILTPVCRSAPQGPTRTPDYRVWRAGGDGGEVGAGWRHPRGNAGEYIALQLHDPSFPRPVRAHLVQSSDDADVFHLHWNGPSRPASQV